MLRLLTIADLGVIDHLEMELRPGLNVFTGETGSGKSIIIDSLGLLLGGRADAALLRADADRARVEGIFTVDNGLAEGIAPILRELGLDDATGEGEIILAREINRDGRNTCRVNGRLVPLKSLTALGERIVDIHSQGQHLSLLRPAEHIDLLDCFAGLLPQRAQVAGIVDTLRGVQRDIERLQEEDRDLAQRIDLLRYQAEEIAAADLRDGEDETLERERTLLGNAEALQTLAGGAYRLLEEGEGGQPSLIDLLGRVLRDLTDLEVLDSSLGASRELTANLTYQVEELARTLRDYGDDIDRSPARLQEVEERLTLIAQLKRKYGDTLEDVRAFGQRAADQLDAFSTSEEAELHARERELLERLGYLAGRLSQERRLAATRLEKVVEGELAELAMEGTLVHVQIKQTESDNGVAVTFSDQSAAPVQGRYAFTGAGIDRVELLIAPNPGEPLHPLVKIASGGETARLMLAFKVALAGDGRIPTLAFDEIDSGVGGRIGFVVGKKLWSLSSGHQVLCVTHLPQVAAFADNHIRVAKSVAEGRTTISVASLRPDDRVTEISQMLGGTGPSARRNAAEIVERAAVWKEEAVSPGPRLVMVAS